MGVTVPGPSPKWSHAVFVLQGLAYVTQHSGLEAHPCCRRCPHVLPFSGRVTVQCVQGPHAFIHSPADGLLLPRLGCCGRACSDPGCPGVHSSPCSRTRTQEWNGWIPAFCYSFTRVSSLSKTFENSACRGTLQMESLVVHESVTRCLHWTLSF